MWDMISAWKTLDDQFKPAFTDPVTGKRKLLRLAPMNTPEKQQTDSLLNRSAWHLRQRLGTNANIQVDYKALYVQLDDVTIANVREKRIVWDPDVINKWNKDSQHLSLDIAALEAGMAENQKNDDPCMELR